MNNDRFTIRAVVNYLGLFALLALAATTWLVHSDNDATVVSGAMGVALGALGALLASTRTTEAPPPPPPARDAGGGPAGDAAP